MNSISMQDFRIFVFIMALLSLPGCGGGSGGTAPGFSSQVPLWMVFRADKAVDELFELYSVLDDGSNQPVKLSSPSIVSSVQQFTVSPNGIYVAYTAREDGNGDGVIEFTDGPLELFWVKVDGSEPAVKISGQLPAHASILAFDWSPDSSRLVFRSDIDTDDVDELYMVEFNNTTPVKINGNVGTTVEMGEVIWSPNSRYVAQVVRNRENRFIIDRVAINVYDTTLGTANSTRVSGATLTGSFFTNGVGSGANIGGGIIWSPDSTRLAYLLDNRSASTRHHYQAFPDGTNQRVTGSLGTSEDGALTFEWSGDSRYLAYGVFTSSVGTMAIEVFDSTNSSVARIITAPNGGSIIARTNSIKWQPQGDRIAVAMSQSSGGPMEMFIVAVDNANGTLTPASGVLAADTFVDDYDWSPDSSRLGYLLVDSTDSTRQLYTMVPDGVPVLGSHDSVGTSQRRFFQWLPDSGKLLYGFGDGFYVSTADSAGSFISISAGLDTQIPGPFNSTSQSARAAIRLSGPDANKIGMLALKPGTGTAALFTSNADGSGLTDVTGDLIPNGNVTSLEFARTSIF